MEGNDTSVWATSLGGDDILAFLDGGDWTQLSSNLPSEVGIPSGWLSVVWTDFGR